MTTKSAGTDPVINNLVKSAGDLLLRGGTLESSGGSGPVANADLVDAVAHTLTGLAPPGTPEGAPTGAKDLAVAKAVVMRARRALDKVRIQGKEPSSLTAQDLSALEVIVNTVGRPALRYRNGRVELPPNKLGDNSRWFILVATEREKIDCLSKCVGRFGSEGPLGASATGWRVGKDYVITNRHVASGLVVDRNQPIETWKTDATKSPFIDFAYTDQTAGPARMEVGELVFCAPEPDIDLAIFRVTPANSTMPPAITIDWSESALGRTLPATDGAAPVFQGQEIYAIGHPFVAVATQAMKLVFEEADGRKRCSPGVVMGVDPKRPLLFHDSSTLSGNSGSCVAAIVADGRHVAVGLHYGGRELPTEQGSGLGSANYAVAFSRIAEHPAAQFLRSGS